MSSTEDNTTYKKTSFLAGNNSEFINEFYADYLSDPKSLPQSWRQFFDGLSDEQKLIYDDYKSRIEAKRTEVKNVKQSSDRKALFGDTNGNQTHKERFMTANERLERQNETILNARRTVAETEEVGAEINENLAMNREKIESSHMKVKELQADLDSADRITKSMVDRSKCSIM